MTATATPNAQSNASVISISIGGGGQRGGRCRGSRAIPLAQLSSSGQLNIAGNADVPGDLRTLPRTPRPRGGGGGVVNGSCLTSIPRSHGNTKAFADNNSTVTLAGNLEFEATSTATGSATTSVGNGGVFADGGATANANVNPVIQAYIGNNVQVKNVTGNIVIQAESVRAEGDASAEVDGGGAAFYGAANSTVNSNPTVNAYIGTGSTVNAGWQRHDLGRSRRPSRTGQPSATPSTPRPP